MSMTSARTLCSMPVATTKSSLVGAFAAAFNLVAGMGPVAQGIEISKVMLQARFDGD
jgi:hypothetical protein